MNEKDYLNGAYDEALKRWKETLETLYGANYVKIFCTYDTFKQHLKALGYLKGD